MKRRKGQVILTIFNLFGSAVSTLLNEDLEPGIYPKTFNATDLPSGIYFYQIKIGKSAVTRQMLFLK